MGQASVGTSDKIDDQSTACSNDKRQRKEKMEKNQVSARRTGWRLLVLFSGDVDNTLHMCLLKEKYTHYNTTIYLHHCITI